MSAARIRTGGGGWELTPSKVPVTMTSWALMEGLYVGRSCLE